MPGELERRAEEWAKRGYGPIEIEGEVNWSRKETEDAYLCGLRAGLGMALDTVADLERFGDGEASAYYAIRALLSDEVGKG